VGRGEFCERQSGNEEQELTQRAQKTQRLRRREKEAAASCRTPGK
jgi:hypothetical protein